MKTAKQKLSEQYVQSVYVIRVKGNNGYVMIDENTTDDIEQARAFQYAEALEYAKGFENTYEILKYVPDATDEDTNLESEDENPDEFSLPHWKLEDKAEEIDINIFPCK